MSQSLVAETQVSGFRLARIDEDFHLDRYAEDASSKDYTTTIYQVPSIQTEGEIIGISDNKGYLKLFNIQQNEYAIYKLFVESEEEEGGTSVIPLNTSWRQFKFISNNHLSTPRTYKSRLLFENEDDEPPCYHECPGYKLCFLQQNSNKVFYSIVHFGKAYYENDSLYARSTNVYGCAQHQDQITCFDIENNYLVTGSINGDVKVWIHKEESIELNQDESFELAWMLKGVHKKQFLQKIAILIPTSGHSKNPFIVSGGGPDGTVLIHDIESQQLLQQVILEASPLSLMKEFLPSSSLIACNQLGTVYLYEESEDVYSKNILSLQLVYYIISDQSNITVNSVTCFFMNNNDMVNVFSVTFKDKKNRVVSNSLQFYIGQLLVMEYSFETPILFCTVFSMKRENRINVKSSIPLPGSHLVACDKDGRGHVWLIDEIISQIVKKDQHSSDKIENDDTDLHNNGEETDTHNTSFSLETPRPHSLPKQMAEQHHSPSEVISKFHPHHHESTSAAAVDYSSHDDDDEEELLSDVSSVRSSSSSISLLPREVKHVPKPTKSPSNERLVNDDDPTIPQTMDQMLWSQEFTTSNNSRPVLNNDRIDRTISDLDRHRDTLTPEPQIINIRKAKLPTKQLSPHLQTTHSFPEEELNNEPSSSSDEDLIDTPQINDNIPKPIIVTRTAAKQPRTKDTSGGSVPTPTATHSMALDSSTTTTTANSCTTPGSKPARRRIQPETTTVVRTPSIATNTTSIPQEDDNITKKSSGTASLIEKPTPKSSLKTSSSSSQVKVVNHFNAVAASTEPVSSEQQVTPSITPNSSKRIEYKLYQKQTEQFNEQAARQVLLTENNPLFTKNEAEKVLNYTPGESMFGNLATVLPIDHQMMPQDEDKKKKNYEMVETKLRKQVSKKHLEEMKQRPSIMDLYVKEHWEKEVTLEQTGPRIIYSLSFDDQEDSVLPHPKDEYESIRKFLKENPII